MSIENLFGGILADRDNKLSGVGNNPTAIGNMGNPMNRIKQGMKLPEKIDAQTVINEEKELGKVDAEIQLGQQIVQRRRQRLDKLVQLQKVNSDWSNTTMDIDLKLREIKSGQKQEVSQYMLGAAKTQAYLDGYQQAYNVSEEIFS